MRSYSVRLERLTYECGKNKMPEVKNILVGVDLSHGDHLISAILSPETLAAIEQAIEQANRQSARLTIFSVIDLDPHTLSYMELEDETALKNLGRQAEEVLRGLVDSAKA